MSRAGEWVRKDPQTAYEAVMVHLALFAQHAKAQGDMRNHFRFKALVRETSRLAPDPRQLDLVEIVALKQH